MEVNLDKKEYVESKENYFDNVPDEIMLHIFSFLNNKDLLKEISLTCKKWDNLTKDNSRWKKISFNDFPDSYEEYNKETKEPNYYNFYSEKYKFWKNILSGHIESSGMEFPKVPWLFENSFFISDSRSVVINKNGSISVWDIEDKCLEGNFKINSKKFQDVLLHKNKLIAGATDGTIAIWDLSTNSLIQEVNKHQEELMDLKLWKDCYMSYSAKALYVCNLETGDVIKELKAPDNADIKSIDIFDHYLVVLIGHEISVYDLDDLDFEIFFTRLIREVTKVKIGENLIVGQNQTQLYMWDYIGNSLAAINGRILNFKVYKTQVIIQFADKPLTIWDKNNRTIKEIDDNEKPKNPTNHFDVKDNKMITLSDVDVSPSGNTLSNFSKGNILHFWDIKTGILLKSITLQDKWNLSTNPFFELSQRIKILNKKIIVAYLDFFRFLSNGA